MVFRQAIFLLVSSKMARNSSGPPGIEPTSSISDVGSLRTNSSQHCALVALLTILFWAYSPAFAEMNNNLEKLEYKIQSITLPAYTHKVASLFTTAFHIREDLNNFSTLQDNDTESRYRTAYSLNKSLDNFFDRLGPSSSDPREFPDAFHALAAAIIPHSNSPEGFANTKMHEMVARTYGRMVGIAYMGHSFEHLAKPGLSTAMKMIDEHGMTNMADYLADAVIWIHDDQKRGVIGARTIIEALIKRPEISQNSGENEKNQYDESMLARNEALLKIWKSTNLDPDHGGHNILKAFLVQEGLIQDDEKPGQNIPLQSQNTPLQSQNIPLQNGWGLP
ncbi:MAG: hypothetical protein H6853_00515 [Rhodospirillales bacterium]|nr:MAG: hypothetical protein H6853_00515 [Rhodospirillales bacterium]